ncbi:CsbD family protein [Streptomyces sp. NPDC001070]
MGAEKKAKHAGQKMKGKAEEATGKLTGDESLRRKGKADQVGGDVKQVVEKGKDAGKDAFGR